MQSDLPFPRGSTFCDGDATAIAALDGELEGKRYLDYDPTTGGEQELIVLKATTALTAPGGKVMENTTGYYKKRTAGAAGTAGIHGFIADPSFTGNVASGDLFYAIYSGEVSGVKVGTTNLTQGGVVSTTNTGTLTPQPATDHVAIGIAHAAVTAAGDGETTATITVLPPAAGVNAA